MLRRVMHSANDHASNKIDNGYRVKLYVISWEEIRNSGRLCSQEIVTILFSQQGTGPVEASWNAREPDDNDDSDFAVVFMAMVIKLNINGEYFFLYSLVLSPQKIATLRGCKEGYTVF